MNELDKMARGLLAAEYDRAGSKRFAEDLRSDCHIGDRDIAHAVGAIRAALLTAPPGHVPAMYQVRPRSFPAGEGWREVSKREFDNYGDFPGYPEVEWERRKLYAAQQPASAIDLEQFRETVGRLWKASHAGSEDDLSLGKLLALIDGQAGIKHSKGEGE